ncbi:SMI1/KNR4 family protein [Solibacillus ferritrahens]|uniref:SMI1/KNR4 family protein n=1 Tax=Solibacillus ferritrahens TaxID=3098620 RepID=UPI0030089B8D
METKLKFLKEYTLSKNQNIEIIPYQMVREIGPGLIPNSWCDIFENNDNEKRKELLLKEWKAFSSVTLSNTISYLTENLYEVDLISFNNRYSILYSVKTHNGEIEYYEGRNPFETKSITKTILNNNWDKIPQSVKDFYENIHNGFYYYASKAMGLVPLDNVTYFGDDEWGIIESLNEPIRINLETTFGFFKSGMGGYVAIDYENAENDNATLWFSNDQPEYNVNFWDIIDEWIVIGFQDE